MHVFSETSSKFHLLRPNSQQQLLNPTCDTDELSISCVSHPLCLRLVFPLFIPHFAASSRKQLRLFLENPFTKCVVIEPSQGKRKHFACCSFCKRRHLAFNDLAVQLFMLVPPFRIPCRRCLHPNFPGWFCFHLCCLSPSAHVWTIKRALGLIAYHSMSLSPPNSLTHPSTSSSALIYICGAAADVVPSLAGCPGIKDPPSLLFTARKQNNRR